MIFTPTNRCAIYLGIAVYPQDYGYGSTLLPKSRRSPAILLDLWVHIFARFSVASRGAGSSWVTDVRKAGASEVVIQQAHMLLVDSRTHNTSSSLALS